MSIEPRFFEARDGVRLAWREMGEGRPVVLLHGLFSNAEVNWIKFGTAARVADAGFRVIMPDLRVHGLSDAPHEPDLYPPDILVQDLQDLVAHLGLTDFDLGGFSLGARTSTRAVVAGMRPRRLILGGMGLAGLAGWARRGQFFQRVIADYETAKRGDETWMSIQFMKTMKIDRVAASLLLDSFTDTTPDMLAALTMPTLLVCGDQDQDNGSAEELAAALPDARFGPLLTGTPKGDIRHLVPDARAVAAMDDPAMPALLLFPRFGANAAVRAVAAGEAFVRLTQASTNYVALGERGFDTLTRFARDVPKMAVDYPDGEAAIAQVEALWAAL